MKSQDRYFIGPGLRDKLRDIVRAHDGAATGSGASEIPVRLQDMGRIGSPIRFGVVYETWVKGWKATVTQLKSIDASPKDPEATFEAWNWFRTITATSQCPRRVACAKVESAWIVIESDEWLRQGTFHGPWPKGSTKDVSLEKTRETDPQEIVTVTNSLADLSNECGYGNCIVADLNGWTLVSAEIS